MLRDFRDNSRPLIAAWVFVFMALLFGQGLGIAFGAAEDSLKGGIEADAAAVFDTVYKGDDAKKAKITSKSWSYFKRAHLHANAMGTTAAVLVLVLSFLPGLAVLRGAAGAALGAGSFGYGLFWLLAGMKAPSLGSTGAAKEALGFIGMPSAAIFVAGTVVTLVLVLMTLTKRSSS